MKKIIAAGTLVVAPLLAGAPATALGSDPKPPAECQQYTDPLESALAVASATKARLTELAVADQQTITDQRAHIQRLKDRIARLRQDLGQH
jgi:hypothetical protein